MVRIRPNTDSDKTTNIIQPKKDNISHTSFPLEQNYNHCEYHDRDYTETNTVCQGFYNLPTFFSGGITPRLDTEVDEAGNDQESENHTNHVYLLSVIFYCIT